MPVGNGTPKNGPSRADRSEDAPQGELDEGGRSGPGSEADATDAGSSTTGQQGNEAAVGPTVGSSGRREVEVPRSLYKVVTVFSTLIAVLCVVFGFVALDAATTVLSNPPGSIVIRLLALAGPSVETLSAHSSTIAVLVGLLGLALVVVGAGVYVYGSRFRAPGMGKPKDEAEEETDDG